MILHIVRGVSGTGKTTYAHELMDDPVFHTPPFHFEADMFFTDHDGTYRFDTAFLREAHEWCQLNVKRHMRFKDPVIVSNTFTTFRELRPYIDMAIEFEYAICVKTMDTEYGSVHAVPEDAMNRQRMRFVSHDEMMKAIAKYLGATRAEVE